MKKRTIITLALFLIAASVAISQTFYGHSKVQIARGLSMTETTWLDFGQITATSEGTVTITPTGIVALSEGLVAKGSTSPSVFEVVAMPTSTFIITLPTSCTLSSGTNQIYLTNFTSNLTNGVGVTDANGLSSVSIGGKVSIPAAFVFGSYSGGFAITVSYQ